MQTVPEATPYLSFQHVDGFNWICFNSFQVNQSPSVKLINPITESLQIITSLIESTLKCRSLFAKTIETHKGLYNVKVENFIGLGAVR